MTAGHRHTVFWLIGFALFFLASWLFAAGCALARYLASPVYDPANSKPAAGTE